MNQLPEQRTAHVEYKCKKGHSNRFTFGEKPPSGVEVKDAFIYVRTTSYFDGAMSTISAHCTLCRRIVSMTRVGPQPE